mmetsp:Transcript_3114/g.8455  ORF Transcript_3114/g.8455 Transcript_3114/m.8455 type:complete len:186 (+) Transcript_3114:158-715(+)|eukprot:CAMPEP_0119132056 /NCGR_PEP_ID=MMETSP1310-20130426/11290_1 /TAXON_ID=464262 /ORGANISM="Genus nov. species nov., Strain RCC2339" /LENGTH=185 /DNA_ID=CAMNT_0007122667 /DNA_START=145 /DNA_END=702 /DNA_ORIENTATION=+
MDDNMDLGQLDPCVREWLQYNLDRVPQMMGSQCGRQLSDFMGRLETCMTDSLSGQGGGDGLHQQQQAFQQCMGSTLPNLDSCLQQMMSTLQRNAERASSLQSNVERHCGPEFTTQGIMSGDGPSCSRAIQAYWDAVVPPSMAKCSDEHLQYARQFYAYQQMLATQGGSFQSDADFAQDPYGSNSF